MEDADNNRTKPQNAEFTGVDLHAMTPHKNAGWQPALRAEGAPFAYFAQALDEADWGAYEFEAFA